MQSARAASVTGLVYERTSIINRMKSILIQFGVRKFNPKLRNAAEKLGAVRTPEGVPLPVNTIAMLRRQMERKRMIEEQIKAIEQDRRQRLERDPTDKRNAMVLMLTRIIGLGVETAEQLVHEILSRNLRDRKAVARYAGLTGSPDESGAKRREKGLSRSGNGRVRNSADPVVLANADIPARERFGAVVRKSAPPMPRVRANPSSWRSHAN